MSDPQRPVALVRRPGPRLGEGLVTHIERSAINHALALDQWDGYLAALQSTGWNLLEVPPADDCPDAVFVEDTVVVFRNVAVITRPGAPSRRGEVVEVEKVIDTLGLSVAHITAPATLDGGDVLKVGATIYAGRGGRTNAAGVRQLRDILTPFGATVIAVPLPLVLHLKSAVTALPDGSIIGYPPVVDAPAFFRHFVAMPDEAGAHVVCLGGSRLLMATDCPASVRQLENLGYEVISVDISEFEKLEGCVTCLSVRLRDVGTR